MAKHFRKEDGYLPGAAVVCPSSLISPTAAAGKLFKIKGLTKIYIQMVEDFKKLLIDFKALIVMLMEKYVHL